MSAVTVATLLSQDRYDWPDRCVLEVEGHTHASELARRLRLADVVASYPWPSPHDTWLVAVAADRERARAVLGPAMMRGVLVHASEDTV